MNSINTKLLISSCGVFLLAIIISTPTFANENFVIQTGKSCSACHEMARIPVLNQYGKAFKLKLPKKSPQNLRRVNPKKTKLAITITKNLKKPVTSGKESITTSRKYIGSQVCGKAGCHQDTYKGWQNTYHSKMIQSRDKGILKNAVTQWTYDSNGNQGPAIGNITDSQYSILDVKYVIGSKWKQLYLVSDPNTGGYQFLNKQFNAVSNKWESYINNNDWDTDCITCHTTGYRLNKYNKNAPKQTQWKVSELNIGCESCHGPGSVHALTTKKEDIYNPARKSITEQTRLCGYCHQRIENNHFLTKQGNPREDLPAPTIGQTFNPWDNWQVWYPKQVIMPGVLSKDKLNTIYKGNLADAFAINETGATHAVYEETKDHEEYQGMLQSKHYGKLSCTSCHNPHQHSMKTGSLKTTPEKLCSQTGCHKGAAPDFWKKIMPATAKIANNLYILSHTFYQGQNNKDAGLTGHGIEANYYFKK